MLTRSYCENKLEELEVMERRISGHYTAEVEEYKKVLSRLHDAYSKEYEKALMRDEPEVGAWVSVRPARPEGNVNGLQRNHDFFGDPFKF